MIEFRGKHINPEKVSVVGEVKIIRTGSLHCDWDYGFLIFTKAGAIEIIIPTKTDGCGNHILDRDARSFAAEKERLKLIKPLTK